MTVEFQIGAVPSCGETAAADIRVQMTTMYKSWPLFTPTWDNPTILESTFTYGDVRFNGSPEAGAMGADSVTLECGNEDMGGVRMYDLIRGVASGYEFNQDTYILFVRVLHKPSYNNDYTVRYWGWVDFKSIEADFGDVSDPDTWMIRFDILDSIFLLEEVELVDFVNAVFPMSGSYQATQKYITGIGTLSYAGDTYYAGKYELANAMWNNGDRAKWLGQWQQTSQPDGVAATAPIRYFRIIDILQTFHTYLGLEANAMNDGRAWGDAMPWKFFYNAGNGGSSNPALNTVFNAVGFDELYVVSGFYVWDGAQNVYAHRHTFFDRDRKAPHSFFHESNPLEMLKQICLSFGLVARVAVNSSNQRYLQVNMIDDGNLAIPYGDDSNWYSNVKLKYYSRGIDGVEVVSEPGYSNMVRGTSGNSSLKVNCKFTLANATRVDSDFRSVNGRSSGVSCVYGNRDDGNGGRDLWGALWTLQGTPTGLVYPTAYTICAIEPKLGGAADVATASGGGVPYIQQAGDGTGSATVGKIVGTYGGYDFTLSGVVTNPVMYPNDEQPVNVWAEVPAMALAHYWYSPYKDSLDRLGLYRKKGLEIEIERAEIFYATPTAGSRVEVIINGETFDCRVVSATENLLENTTKFKLEAWRV